jgi:hypothetical protein
MFQIMYVFLPRAKIIRLAFSQTFSTWWVKEFIVDVNPQVSRDLHCLEGFPFLTFRSLLWHPGRDLFTIIFYFVADSFNLLRVAQLLMPSI